MIIGYVPTSALEGISNLKVFWYSASLSVPVPNSISVFLKSMFKYSLFISNVMPSSSLPRFRTSISRFDVFPHETADGESEAFVISTLWLSFLTLSVNSQPILCILLSWSFPLICIFTS